MAHGSWQLQHRFAGLTPPSQCPVPPNTSSIVNCLAADATEDAHPPYEVIDSDAPDFCGNVSLLNLAEVSDMNPYVYVDARSAAQVVRVVRCAKASGATVCPQSGKHSYVATCTRGGIVLNVRNGFQQFEVDSANNMTTLGSGLCLGQVYSWLSDYNMTLPGGTCASVSVSGLTLGGGKGVLARKYGLLADRLRAVDVVTADGQLITANATHHPELFWLATGAGGSQLPGVVTSFHFELVPQPPYAGWVVAHYNHTLLDAAVRYWQEALLASPNRNLFPRLQGSGYELYGQTGVIEFWIAVVAEEGENENNVITAGQAVLDGIVEALGEPLYSEVTARSWLDNVMAMAMNPPYDPAVLEDCVSQLPWGSAPSFYKNRALVFGSEASTSRKWAPAFVNIWKRLLVEPKEFIGNGGYLQLEATNGAIQDREAHATPYSHRNDEYDITMQLILNWPLAADGSEIAGDAYRRVSLEMLDEMRQATGSYAGYVNYLDDDLDLPVQTSDAETYFGSNAASVHRFISRYDPGQLFLGSGISWRQEGESCEPMEVQCEPPLTCQCIEHFELGRGRRHLLFASMPTCSKYTCS